ncbi:MULTISPECIES: RNA-binding protein [Sinorhizobium]|uniref:RNA-binding protein n=1 Tax=Sinorhizobium TaxID=28105 RepID=UPI0004BB0FAE|nr:MULTISPECIES: RNA-binding protein [Sinorhizobium]ASY58907.1 proteinPredicted nucleic-acid-binding protein implicated in transcription termination [Sinorhizobium sp. CCBAU 05631]PDT53688.1 DNA-binding protein [Sinorhizobium sp. NG07B]POH30751.1 DNA-binding protein [Sinorhizobium americanum]
MTAATEILPSEILPSDKGPKDRSGSSRTCIVTRESGLPDELIRFVAGPDGRVVPDLKRQLPGRGCWVRAERRLVEKAVAKKLFARALRAEVKAEPALADEVDRLLAEQLAGMMNMARKAGQFVSGATKTEQAVRGLAALAVFHATEAAADGVRKIDQARKAMSFVAEDETEIPAFRPFAAAEMEELLGSNAFIHAAALAGQAGEGVVKRAIMLEKYRGSVPVRAEGGADKPQQ